MLIERTFEIGGALCWGLAVLFAIALAMTGLLGLDAGTAIVPILFGVIGTLFFAVGRQARDDRRRLLDLPAPPGDSGGTSPSNPRDRR